MANEEKKEETPPRAKTGAYQTRYHPLTNPPPALLEILKILRKRVRDNGILGEKPSIGIHSLREYSGESWGPADDASRFLFRWGCVIPLDNGKWLLDKERFEYVVGCSDSKQIPEAAVLPNVRIGQLLQIPDTKPSAEEEDFGTLRLLKSAAKEVGEEEEEVEETVDDEDDDGIPVELNLPAKPDFGGLKVTGPIHTLGDLPGFHTNKAEKMLGDREPIDDEIHPENLLFKLEEIKDKHTDIIRGNEYGTEGLWGLQILVEQGVVEKRLLPFAYDVLIHLSNIIDEIAGWREQNAGLKTSLERSVVWRDQLDMILLVIDDNLDSLKSLEKEFDGAKARVVNLAEAVTSINQEAEALVQEIARLDEALLEFVRWGQGLKSEIPELAVLLNWRKRIRDADDLVASRRQKWLRLKNTLIDPETLRSAVETEKAKASSAAARHSELIQRLACWTELCDQSGMALSDISWLSGKIASLKMGRRFLDKETQELPGLGNIKMPQETPEETFFKVVETVLERVRSLAYPVPTADVKKPTEAAAISAVIVDKEPTPPTVITTAPTSPAMTDAKVTEITEQAPTAAAETPPAVEVPTWERIFQQCTPAEVTMVKRVVIALASVIGEKVKRGRTCQTILNHILAPQGLVDWTVPQSRLEMLVRKLSKVRPQVLQEVLEHDNVFQRPLQYGQNLADIWAKELGITESGRDTMLQLRKARDNDMYSPETRQYYKELREKRKKENEKK